MVKKYTRKHQKLVKKKRKWYTIYAPEKLFNKIELGEIFAAESTKLVGRHVDTNIGTVSKIKNNNLNVIFRVKEVKEEKGYTELVGYEISSSFIKRATRKKKSKVDYSIILKTKDDIELVTKIFLVTRSLVSAKTLTGLRHAVTENLTNVFSNHKLDDIFEKTLSHDIQNELKNSLKSIYPLSVCEIRYLRRK